MIRVRACRLSTLPCPGSCASCNAIMLVAREGRWSQDPGAGGRNVAVRGSVGRSETVGGLDACVVEGYRPVFG
jgi:hypothetical protein